VKAERRDKWKRSFQIGLCWTASYSWMWRVPVWWKRSLETGT